MSLDFSAAYASVVKSLLTGNIDVAAQTLGTVPNWQAPADSRYIPRNVPMPVQVTVFRRDHFTCRYCGRRAVFPPVLRLLSISLKEVFPYHRHGRMSECHLAFWRDLASCDHLVPVARFGSSDEHNLVTTCYMCNSMKQNWTVEELGWRVREISPHEIWDGLSSSFPMLLEVSAARFEEARIPYFQDWLRTIQSQCR